LRAKSLTVSDKAQGGSNYSLNRGADGWEMSAPRPATALEPRNARRPAGRRAGPVGRALRRLRRFARLPRRRPYATVALTGLISGLFWTDVNAPNKAPQWLVTRAGPRINPNAPSASRATTASTVELLIGKSAGSRLKKVDASTAARRFPASPIEVDEPEEFFYAKLKGQSANLRDQDGQASRDVFRLRGRVARRAVGPFQHAPTRRAWEISQSGREILC